jgi:hypothetical protein
MNPYYPCHRGPVQHAGLVGIFGGVINLTTAALQGGARIVRTVVEGTMWHAVHDGCCEPEPRCCCHVECEPPVYPGSHRCC